MLESVFGCFGNLTLLALTGISSLVIYFGRLFFNNSDEKKRLSKILRQKQNERQEAFSRLRETCKFGSEEKEIISLSWDELMGKLQSRQLSATKSLEAFIGKALEVSDKCNPITDFIPQAHEWARELDEMSEVKGPLHGIPFCVKDDMNVIGMDTTHGFVKRLYNPAKESGALVKALQDLGGIPFCKTNIPQTLFTYGSDNPVFGATTNSHNCKLSPGGSSSGTGALVGAGGAFFGTGSDIGGSLRIPAHFNGVSSIKPTVGRVSDKGFVSSLPNVIGVGVSLGIIAQNPNIVATVSKYLLENGIQMTHDPAVLPIQWDGVAFESKKKLRIGYFTSLPYFPPMGDSSEILLKTKEALESLGHTLVPFTMPDAYHFMKVFGKFVLADQARHFKKCWKGEEVAKSMKLVWIGSKLPLWLQKIVGRVLISKVLPFAHSKRTGIMFGSGASTSVDLWDAMGQKNEIIDQMSTQWDDLKLDSLICNAFPFPAPLIDSPGMLSTATAYNVIWNLVDFPTGVVTMGSESGRNLDLYDDEGDMTLKLAKKSVKASVGSPIGIQVVGKPFREEVVLRVMKELEPFNQFKSNTN